MELPGQLSPGQPTLSQATLGQSALGQPTLGHPALGPAPAGADQYPYRRLYRDPGNKIIAGVAAGVAEHLRMPVVAVRMIFIALLAANGVGALMYVAFWAILPVVPDSTAPVGSGSVAPPRPERSRSRVKLQVMGLCALAAGVVLFELQVNAFGVDPTVLALGVLVVMGAGLMWQQATPSRRRRDDPAGTAGTVGTVGTAGTVSTIGTVGTIATVGSAAVGRAAPSSVVAAPALGVTERDRRWFVVRVVGGGLLVIIGIIGILGLLAPGSTDLSATLTGMLFALLALTGLVLALAPALWRIFGQLGEERVARIREQERAEVAALVHDQVLHTLALIQRNATDASSVVRLARGQERTLRHWLYAPTGSPTERFAAALEQVAAEVEDSYAIGVETVVVGDAAHGEGVAALVAAVREALVNAARHAGVSSVSLYAEADADQLSVYVRDRGRGFDPATVDGDRHGIRGSIIGRMQRHGGRAEVRSAPGEGTEVELVLPLTAPRAHDATLGR